MYDLPTSVTIGEQSFAIRNRGDFRVVIDCFSALNDDELTDQEKIFTCLIIFYQDIMDIDDLDKLGDLESAVKQMFNFFNCNQPEDILSSKKNPKLIDWETDTNLICAAVNNVAKKEVRAEEYVHWWTFMGYYMSVGESALSTVVAIRHKIVSGKKLEKYEQEFKRDNPQYFRWNRNRVADKEAQDWVMTMWNS